MNFTEVNLPSFCFDM